MPVGSCDVKFAVFTDLHFDIMHDAADRITAFLKAAQQEKVDFIIQLGDLMYPDHQFLAQCQDRVNQNDRTFRCERDSEKKRLLGMLEQSGIPVRHVLGNHELDKCTKETAVKYYGCPGPYYSFDAGNTHFIILDTNFILQDGKFIPYECANYHYYNDFQHPALPKEQLQWLENEISESDFPSVLFSHHSLSDSLLAVKNRPDIREVFLKLDDLGKLPILCMNGHSHIDGLSYLAGVPCMDVNSMSNIWLGRNYSCTRYSENIDLEYPYIKFTAPYRDALFAIVTIKDGVIRITGEKSKFVGPSPYELGFPKCSSEFLSTPQISSHEWKLSDR